MDEHHMFGITSQCDVTFDLIINAGHNIFMVQCFLPFMLQDNVTV